MKSERGLMQLLIAVEIAVLILMILLGIFRQIKGTKEAADYVVNTQDNQFETASTDTGEIETGNTITTEAQPGFSEEILAQLSEMTVEQKVAQIFFVTPEALTGADRVTIAGEGTRTALTDYPVGGLLYARTNYRNETQMTELLNGAQTMSYEQSGRYLFTGTLSGTEENAIVTALNGREELLVQYIGENGALEEADLENLMQISLATDVEQLPTEQTEEILTCYQVGTDIELAVAAIENGADMLCVEDHFTEVYDAVLAAVNEQNISEDVINHAVGRILTEKTENER